MWFERINVFLNELPVEPYSYLRHSIGSRFAAFLAGHTPKMSPIAVETPRPATTAQAGIEAGSCRNKEHDDGGNDDGDDDSQHATKKRQGHRFEKKLADDVSFSRPDRFSNSDFARALGDAHQHDVHDANSTNQQADRGYRDGKHANVHGDAVEFLDDPRGGLKVEIVLLAVFQTPAMPQHAFNLVQRLVHHPGLSANLQHHVIGNRRKLAACFERE